MCVSWLIVSCLEYGVMLARILDSVPEHFILRMAALELQV